MKLSLKSILITISILAALAPIIAVLPLSIYSTRHDNERHYIQDLDEHGEETANSLARTLYNQWQQVQTLADMASNNTDVNDMRVRLDTIKAANQQFAWLGVANMDGKVTVATGGVLEGEHVNKREWFINGKIHTYAGDVHEALLLQQYLTPLANEPMRLIDFSTPIKKPDGTIIGVLGAHTNWRWLRQIVFENTTPSQDLLVVSKDGVIQIGPSSIEHKYIDVPSVQAARESRKFSEIETWPDGKIYIVSVIPRILYRDLPDFGWSIIVREPISVLDVGNIPYNWTMFTTGVASLFILILLLSGTYAILNRVKKS